MPRFERSALLQKFKDMKGRGEPIIGGGAGTGLSAKCEEAGGIDLIVIYNSGRYRCGASSMERLPTEIALTEQTRAFKAVGFDNQEG